MPVQPDERITLDKVDHSKPAAEWKHLLADRGRRRHLSYSLDFDTRAHLFEEPTAGWSEESRRLHLEGRERVKSGLAREFGSDDLNRKIDDFVALGPKRFSVVAYHNRFFHQSRRAFVMGDYYPALVSACALGERVLNHMVLDLRDYYKNTPEYRRVYRQSSFDNWRVPIETLSAWNVLRPEAATEFQALMSLRHRSIHFNVGTYVTLREDALASLRHLGEIIDQQFTSHGNRPWFIPGTRGHLFIKREWEENPFIKTFYLPTLPFVGPYFTISFEDGPLFHDHTDYGDGDWSDEEFSAAYEARTTDQLAYRS